MKKIITTLLILSGICTVIRAQTKNTVEFGANIGYNLSNISAADYNGYTYYLSGFNAGVSLEYYFSDKWGIKGKLLYDQKGGGGGVLTFEDGTQIDNVNFHLNYITIPVMANWHFGRTRNWYLNFGPYVGVLMNARESYTNKDIKDDFNSTDFGLAVGIGVKFPISKSVKMFIEADGQGGITDIFKNNPDESVQNSRSSINVGFLIPIK